MFKAMVLGLVQDLADPDVTNPNSGLYVLAPSVHPVLTRILSKENLESIKAALDVATPLSGPVAPVVATVGLSVMFVNWLFGVYNNTYAPASPTYSGVLSWLTLDEVRAHSAASWDI
jgi:hypothetical protein